MDLRYTAGNCAWVQTPQLTCVRQLQTSKTEAAAPGRVDVLATNKDKHGEAKCALSHGEAKCAKQKFPRLKFYASFTFFNIR